MDSPLTEAAVPTNYIEEAIAEHWGERCAEFAEGCPTCDAWAAFDKLAALSARVAGEAMPVAVNDLVWEQPDLNPSDTSCWLGHGIDLCNYYIRHDGRSWVMPGDARDDDDNAECFDTIEAAKAAAQADFEARIRSALHPASVTGAEGWQGIEAARRHLVAHGIDGMTHEIVQKYAPDIPVRKKAQLQVAMLDLVASFLAALDRKGGKDA